MDKILSIIQDNIFILGIIENVTRGKLCYQTQKLANFTKTN